jgi:hypothetical protein
MPHPAAALLVLLLTSLLVAPRAAHPVAQPAPPALEWLGGFDPATPGLNAGVAGLDGFAYLGSWGGEGDCPALGVQVVDVRDPAAPAPLAVAARYPRTTAEHVAAVRVRNAWFDGHVLLAGIQRCSAGGGTEGGLALWDVTDPTSPVELSYLGVGTRARGVHEFAVGQQGDRWYAYLAVPNSELSSGVGDLRVVDLTDPRNPVQVAEWGARRDAGVPIGYNAGCAPDCRGTIAQSFLHSVALSPDGRLAYLSYWYGGVLILDVSAPTAPAYLGRFTASPAAEGNHHSVAIAHGGTLALVADETFAPPWGRLRLVDVQHPDAPVQVGSFETGNSAANRPGGVDTWYGIHNPLVDDRDPNRAYLAWYADGVRVVDVGDAGAPVEVARWVPPARPMVWNVAFMGDLLLVADVNTGLHLLRR